MYIRYSNILFPFVLLISRKATKKDKWSFNNGKVFKFSYNICIEYITINKS